MSKVVVTGEKDSREFSMVALDRKDEERAVGLARRLAEQTGRTVILHDKDGELLGTFRGVARN